MADKFWVGGGASTNWNATGNTNWSLTSGGANNAAVPATGDAVIFDANSGSGTCVMNAAVSLIRFDAHDFAGTLTHNTSITITLSASGVTVLRLPLTGTYTAVGSSSGFSLTHTSGTLDITSNSKRMGSLTINGAGGTTRLLDAIRVDIAANSTFTLTAGVFNANNFNVTAAVFASSGSTARTITMGSGLWTIGTFASSGATMWNLATVTNLTFNKDTANIVIGSNGLAGSRTFAGGGLTYNNLTIDTNSGQGMIVFSGTNTFAALAVGAGNSLELNGTKTILSVPTFAGTKLLPILLCSGTPGTQATLSVASGSIAATWCALRDIVGAGGATFAATDSFSHGNNTGWTITQPDAAGTVLSVAAIVAGVWDEPTAGNVTAGTFGAQLKTVLDAVDTAIADLPTNAELATALGTADDAVLAQIALVKAQTDSLTFTVAGQVDANIKSVADTAITGVGSEADPWGP